MRYFFLTVLALMAFAGNSILCRLALGGGAIDAASFTSIRLLSGVVILVTLLGIKHGKIESSNRSGWAASLMLFIYALGFSYAYLSLGTGTGALILFASVQITILSVGVLTGNRPSVLEWLGASIAFGGFVFLVLPGVHAPPITGFILMVVSGVAWGFYTVSGQGSTNPLADTANNFLKTIPFVIILAVFTISESKLTLEGVIFAVLSGGLASGVGYTIWYMALEGITATQAAVVQLFVPVIAALGGVVFVGEELTQRLVIATILVLGGILMVTLRKSYSVKSESEKI